MAKRKIIKINEEKCNGCGLCIPNCHEGAMQIIDGKVRLISDLLCDGLGACLGHCPEGAIEIEEREAKPFSEDEVMATFVKRGIKDIINQFPKVGVILEEYGIGCVPCNVGSCMLKDIVEIHNLSPENELSLLKKIADVVFPGQKINIPLIDRKRSQTSAGSFSPPILELVEEHKIIKRLIASIPWIVEGLGNNGPADTAKNAVDFIKNYADKFHHAKEEEILFEYFDKDLDILKAMHIDHENGRAHVMAIIEGIDEKDNKKIADHLTGYGKLLTEHIKKEDEILYKWMDRELSMQQVGELFSRFGEVNRKYEIAVKKYVEFVNGLEKKSNKGGK